MVGFMSSNGTARLKGRELLDKFGMNMHEVSLAAGISYPTVHKYVTRPEEIEKFSMRVFYSLLESFGLTVEQMEDLRLGDVFEFVPPSDDG